ncbi:YDG domain-containing protein [Janthinobacterium sp. LB3P112]|uniref:YDG domain-containing protein n=1 Tax=Janthinobacterium sp. LB3P112 TaxID=3424196 RepID=UPI003F20CEA0
MHNHVQHASAFILTPPFAPPLRRTALLLAGCFGAAQANPALPQVVHGQATFNQQGNIFSITNTPNTIINWQSFSIHAGEITRFIQQNGNSAVLNRITGQDPSKILGALESNGKVFLINPNGIVFGQGAKVDVNGLVASSLGLSNADFLSGKREFTAGSVAGGVSNAGTINAGKGGQVLLIAPNVENTGIITAPNGEVILAAGRSVQLADPGNPQLRVLVSAPTDQALNLGQIIAQGGSIGMAGALLSQRGVLNANSAVVGEHGRIVLKASGKALLEAGSVTSATGAVGKGGDIQVLGEQVGLLGNAKVDASGGTGGGTVLLGGDYQGKNAAVQNARQVLVGKDASVHADAVSSGNGGKVIAWGNASAQVHGSISARGGAQGGDGGFVETSGHYLAVDGIRVNTSAAHGKRGNWLLDPYDITVVAGSGGQLGDVDQFADAPSSGNASIGADLISSASSNVTLQATHRINFNSAVNITQQGVGLTAQAGETINVNASITTNGGAVRLFANEASRGSIGAVGSLVNLAAPITSNGGSVYLSGASIGGAGVVDVGSGHLSLISNFQGGAIDLTGSGNQLLGSGIADQTVTLQADNIGINGKVNFGGTAGGAKVIIKPLSSSRSIDLGTKSGTALSLNAAELAGISAAKLSIGDGTNTGGIQISDALARTGDLHLNAASTITATGAVTVDGTFSLDGGNWVQNAAALPGFSARNFSIGSGASFLRVAGGDGVSSPYLLADIFGLQGIASLGLGNSYRLAGNIDASGTVNWNNGQGFVPIGSSGSGFSGVFDGAGFTLSNLKIDRSMAPGSAAGLFGTVQGGTLRKLTLSGGSVAGTANVGALAGEVVSGIIDGVNSSMAVSGQRNVGGLVGSNGGAISLSASSGAVTGVNADGGGAIGGLAGWNASGASITTSYATGVVTGAREMIGGLVGNNQGALSQSYATGNVSGARSIGGLVGLNGGSINDAYASGAVGRAGTADSILAWENMGGLVGESTGSVSHVFSSGPVTGNGYAAVGAVAGRVADGSPFSFGYFNADTSLVQIGGGGSSGRSTAQMKQQGSFNDYNFSSVWRIYDGYTTPMLKAFLKPLQVNLSGNATGKVYDGQLATFLGAIGYVGLLDGDAGVNGSLGYGSNARNVGSYAATGLWSTKYDITLGGTTTFAITPRALTVSIGGNGKIYDGTLGYDGANFVLGNVVTGDNISISGSAAFLDKNAGNGKAVHASGLALGGNELGNYSLAATTADGTADITARVLNYGVTGAQSRVYDGTLHAGLNGYFEGLVTGDQVSMTGLLGSFRDKHVGTGKVVDYQVATGQLTGADAGNYVLNGNAGSTTADITARVLNYGVMGAQSRVYDGTLRAGLNGYFEGLVTGDQVSMAGLLGSFRDKHVGTGKVVDYQVATGQLTGADAGNYVLNGNAGSTTADITARVLNYGVTGAQSRVYDGTLHAGLNGYFEGLVTGDQVSMTGLLGSFRDKHVGTGKVVDYQVATGQLTGADAGNYVLNGNAGSTTADITARVLNYGVMGAQSRVYDGTLRAGLNGYFEGLVTGDQVSMAGLLGSFRDKHVGTGKVVDYQVATGQLTGADAGNYVLNGNAGSTTADITARVLNYGVTGAQSRVYDGTLQAGLNGYFEGLVTGDQVSMTGLLGSFRDKHVGTGKVVDYQVATGQLTGADAGNYVLNGNAGSTTADITARTLNVSVNGINKTYDGTTGAQVRFGDDRIQGDALTVVGNAAFGNKNAGSGKAVNVTNVALSGDDAGNYVLSSNAGSTTADIAARTLNVSVNGINKTYDGTTGAQVHFGDDRIQGDALTVVGNAAFGNKNAGAGKAVSVTNVALSGDDAGNYVLSSNAGSTTADIAARALNLSGVVGSKVYDGTTGAQLSLGDDRVAGDSLVASAVANFADKNVGAAKAVQLSGAALTGADAGNYFIVLPTGLLASITPASLTLASLSAAGKVYDGTTSATVNATANGVLGQDVVSVVGGSGSFADKNAGAGKMVIASGFRLAGADAGNYTLETTGGTAQASIAQKQLSTWIGSGNGLWSDTANWDGGVVPEGANVLAVDFSNSKGIVTYSAAAGSTMLKNLNSATGLLLTGGSLTLGESALDFSVLSGLAGLEISGGSLLLNGSLSADRYAQGGGVLSGSGNLLVANSFSQAAGAIRLAGQLAITQAAGDLRFASLAANEVTLSALNGAIGQDGTLLASSLTAQAQHGIVLDHAGNQVSSFTASNSAGGGIVLNNTSAPGTLTLGALTTGAGNIAIDNTGGVTAGNINANGGNVSVTAHSPVTVNGKIEGNDIALNASTDVVLGDGAQLAAARDISLVAGRDIRVEGNAKVLGGGNFSASAGANVRFADTASVALPAAASMSVLAKAGSITGGAGVRVNRQRANVSLLAPNGAVAMPDVIFLPATSSDKPVIDAGVSAAIDDALRFIKQADRANAPLASMPSARPDDKVKDDKDVASGTGKSTGYRDNDSIKKTYCN